MINTTLIERNFSKELVEIVAKYGFLIENIIHLKNGKLIIEAKEGRLKNDKRFKK